MKVKIARGFYDDVSFCGIEKIGYEVFRVGRYEI
jgi:hypothetical protein